MPQMGSSLTDSLPSMTTKDCVCVWLCVCACVCKCVWLYVC